MKENIEYIFKKDYTTAEGTIHQGSQLRFFRNRWFLNGGMLLPAYSKYILDIIDNPKLKDEYLEERDIIFNKC